MLQVRASKSVLSICGLTLFVFWFATYLVLWVFDLGGPPPVFSYIAFAGFGGFVTFLTTIQHKPVFSARDWRSARLGVAWFTLWMTWTILSYFWSSQSVIATQVLINNLEMTLIFLIFTVCISALDARRAVGITLAFVCVTGGVINILDFIEPTFSKVPGRSSGMYVNPNISALILTLSMVSAVPFLRQTLRWPLVILTTTAVFLTFARAGWIILFLSVIYLFKSGQLGFQKTRLLVGLIAISLVGLLGYSILTGLLVDIVLATPISDYLSPNTLSRLGMGGFATDYSSDERSDVLRFAWESFDTSSPLLGVGLGYTHEWSYRVSTHNMYAMYLVEGGFIGLLLYSALILLCLLKPRGNAQLIGVNIAIYSLFSHNILDSPGRILFFAIIFTDLFRDNQDRSSRN